MLRANLKWKLITRIVRACLVLVVAIGMTGCQRSAAIAPNLPQNTVTTSVLVATDGPLSEVNTPASIDRLAPSLANLQPQIAIVSPQADRVLDDDRVSVKFQVSNFPIFKSKELGLGNHLHVILDKQTYRGIYDLTQPLVFENLAPGTHTLRVFASRPWHESFKNPGAYAQTTFHVLTKTAENNPDPQKPLLTYSRPAGKYGAEPIMLDYYLTNAPSHSATTESAETIPDWKIRVTINNQQFSVDRWAPIYLQGFKPGKNLVKIELLDDRGNPIPNVYNESIGAFDYDPQSTDSLAKLIQGKVSADLARSLVDPNYTIATTPVPAVREVTPAPTVTSPVARPLPGPIATPSPVTIAPSPQPIPLPSVAPNPPQQPATLTSPVTPPPQYQPPTMPSAPVVTLPSPVATVPLQPLAQPTPSTSIPPSPAIIPSPQPQQPQPLPSPAISPPAQPSTPPSPAFVTQPVVVPTLVPVPQPQQPSTIPSPVAIVPQQPLPIPLPITIVPPPTSAPSAPVVATPTLQPFPQPVATPIAPTPAPTIAPMVRVPIPTTPAQPTPPPQQLPTPTPVNTPQPAPSPIVSPPLPTIQPPISSDRPEATTPAVEPNRDRWQAKAMEIIQFLGVKIRAFTNTIPAKAQRFGHDFKIWAGQAIDRAGELVRSWQERQAG